MAEPVSIPPILMTGGRGSLAGILRAHFAVQGMAATSYSRRPGGGHSALDQILTGGLPDRGTLLHLAWTTVPFTSEHNPALEHDDVLLRQLLDAAIRRPELHFVFFSSGGTIYGNARGNRPHREIDPCNPIGRHGRAKLAAEKLIEEYGQKHGFPWTILRVSNPYGFPVPGSRPQGIVPVALRCAREGTPLTIWGDGTARKDFLYHADFSAAVEQVVRQRLTGIFNVCHGASHAISEVIGLAEQVTGKKIAVLHTAAAPWDVHDSQLDNTKLTHAANWRPSVSLSEGVARMAIL